MQLKTLKKLTSVLLAVMLVASMCVIGISSVSAAEEATGNTVYFQKPADWDEVACYVYGGTDGEAVKWPGEVMTQVSGDIYSYTIPGDQNRVIFNNNNKGKQTGNLKFVDNNTIYNLETDSWSYYNPETGVITPTEATEPSSDPSGKIFSSVGLIGTINGAGNWNSESYELEYADGVWSIEIEFTGGKNEFKARANDDWDISFGKGESNFTTALTGTYKISIADGAADKTALTVEKVGGPTDPSESTEPTEPTTPVDTDYYLFGSINGENYGCEEDWENMGEYKFVNGQLTVTFETASYVGVKTTDNVAWFMTDGWQGIVNEATLYNTSVLGTDADKLMVPAGEVKFTLVVNADGTLTLSYTAETVPTIPTDPTDPTEPTEPTDPVETEYYLFGSINGENYGCEEDWENMGEYKFVDGQLTVTFETASYVGVKTTNNAAWFMTDGWQGIVNEVTLYNTSVLGTDADKLMVPAGEVKFTLVVNADGTLTLSYTAETVPTIPTDPTDPTEPTTTEPATTEPTTAPQPDVPTDGYYVLGDGLKLKLSTSGTNKMSGTIVLQEGTYKFKLDNYGTLLGYGKTFTDSTNGMTFSKKYSSFCTLNATGGTYTFQVNTDTNTLVVKYDNNLPDNYLIGDLTTVLSPVEGRTLAIGSAYLPAGNYKFKISIKGVEFGYGKTVNDTTNGASLSFSSKYSSYCTLVATGGTYTFTLNTATNRLQIGCVSSVGEANDDVHVSGDGLQLVLDDNGGANDVAVGEITLAEGNYSFKIYNYGVAYTAGAKIVDSATKTLKSSNVSSVTLIATGGTYSFSFNKTNGQLTVKKI